MTAREALILAAGLGTRMRPLTDRLPKPALPFLYRPILHWTLDSLENAGVERVWINLHHLAETTRLTAKTFGGTLSLFFSHEPEILGTAGVFGPIRDHLKEEIFLSVNADIVHKLPYRRLAGDLKDHPSALATLALQPRRPGYTALSLSPGGTIKAFGEGNHMFLGVYAARKGLLDYLPSTVPAEFAADLVAPLLPTGRIRGLSIDSPWFDLGAPGPYLEATVRALADPTLARSLPPSWRLETLCGRTVLLADSAWISQDAFFTGPAVVGENARVEPGARIGNAVLLPGASLLEGDCLEWGLLAPRSRLELSPGRPAGN